MPHKQESSLAFWRHPSWPLFTWFWCKASKTDAWSSPDLLGYQVMTMPYHFAVDPAPDKKWSFSCCFASPCDAVQPFLKAKVRTPSCFYLGSAAWIIHMQCSLPVLLLERHLWHHWPGPTLVLEQHVLVFMMSERSLSEFCWKFCWAAQGLEFCFVATGFHSQILFMHCNGMKLLKIQFNFSLSADQSSGNSHLLKL